MKLRVYKPKPGGYWVLERTYTLGLGSFHITELHDTWEEAIASALEATAPQEPTC